MSLDDCKILWIDEGVDCFPSEYLVADIIIEFNGDRFRVVKNRWNSPINNLPLNNLDLYLEQLEKLIKEKEGN